MLCLPTDMTSGQVAFNDKTPQLGCFLGLQVGLASRTTTR